MMAIAGPTVARWDPGWFAFGPATVRRTRRVTRNFVSVTLGGAGLVGFESRAPDDDVRLVMPVDVDEIALPPAIEREPEFRLIYPEGAAATEIRAYTVRQFDPVVGEIDLEISLHGDGFGSRWAAQVKPGAQVAVSNATGSRFAAGFQEHLVIVDETGLPAAARMIEQLPRGARVTALIEVEGREDERVFASAADVTPVWLHRGASAPGTTRLLESALRGLPDLAPETFVFVVGESSIVRSIRRCLVNERGHNRTWIHFCGYWKRDPEAPDALSDEE